MGKFARGTITGRRGGAFPPVFSAPPPTWRRLQCLPDEARPSVTINQSYLRSLRLTERDRQIVRMVNELGYMTTSQIARIFYAHTKRPTKEAQRRLLWLWMAHVLDRTEGYSLHKAGLPAQLVYMLGDAGRALLREGEVDDRPIKRRRETLLLVHNVLIGELVAATVETLRTLEARWDISYYGEQFLAFQ